jgi:ATP-dependent exoDNAse (exonuclease V) alpha subunit
LINCLVFGKHSLGNHTINCTIHNVDLFALSHDQKKALKRLLEWVTDSSRSRYITLGGYAGTGKTTLIAILRKILYERARKKLKVAFCSYTGRAAQVLKNKLEEVGSLYPHDTVSTIHGLIYSPIENANQEIVGWELKDDVDANLVIADEASMIDRQIWNDLLYFRIPIIAVGDHGQLPPIRGKFNLMEKPQITLEEIHRQAKDNPIIHVSSYARTTGDIPSEQFGDKIVKYSAGDMDTPSIVEELLANYSEDTIILCGYNSTRNKINQHIRNQLGFELPVPQSGDRVICLRNNHEERIYNGMLGTIVSIYPIDETWYDAEINMDDLYKNYHGTIYGPQFGAPEGINFTENRKLIGNADLFDFGYALTVHKAQGSQARKVILFEERFKQMDDEMWRRWLYTGVTRAEEELFVIGGHRSNGDVDKD